jgi:hypothetical protein
MIIRIPVLLVCLFVSTLAAAVVRPSVRDPLVVGAPLTALKSDTTVVYGGAGTLEGKFQTAAGLPDAQGWTTHDLTVAGGNHWHVDPYRAAALDPGTPDNRAWWCGDDFADDCGTGEPAGYGNGWTDWLTWTAAVADPLLPTTVRVTAVANYDLEPGYDYLLLEFEGEDGWGWTARWTAVADAAVLEETFVVPPEAYHGSGGDEIRLRWTVSSDGAWSDEDCLRPSRGAAQVDRIAVSFDQGAGPVEMGLETCEPGDPLLWVPVDAPGVGDFAKVWPLLDDRDACLFNHSPQWAFIDDGVVEPCSPGNPGTVWTYGPFGFVTTAQGGCSVDPWRGVDNEVWSPPIALPAEVHGARLEFDVYRHFPTTPGFQTEGAAFDWHVRFSVDGGATWTGWRDRNLAYIGGPDYRRDRHDVSDLLEPGATHVQIALGLLHLQGIDFGDVGTPAPYFDNVRFVTWTLGAPVLAADPALLADDTFPASGLLDTGDLAALSCRFDPAVDLEGNLRPDIVRGDSIVVTALSTRPGAELVAPPQLHYVLKPNPLFDGVRTSGFPLTGAVLGDSVDVGRWAFDLPDDGFLFPGDQLHYRFTVTDRIVGAPGSEGTAQLPASSEGFGVFPGDPGFEPTLWPSDFTVRALPTFLDAAGTTPEILVWLDDDDPERLLRWTRGLHDLGLEPGTDYDLFMNRAPADFQHNGLGAAATLAQLDTYAVLLYACGDNSSALEGPIDGVPSGYFEKSDDVGLLDAWLAGGRRLFASGNRMAIGMQGNNAAEEAFLADRLGMVALTTFFDQASVRVELHPDAGFVLTAPWLAGGHCPDLIHFDAINAAPSGVVLADLGAELANRPALVLTEGADGSRVVAAPVAWSDWTSPDDHVGPLSARVQALADILAEFGVATVPATTGVDAPTPFYARIHPNPFNPEVTIDFGMPRAGAARIAVHDLRGRAVRVLLDGALPAGPQAAVWDGRADDGRALPSGVYFASVEAAGERAVRKLALVR